MRTTLIMNRFDHAPNSPDSGGSNGAHGAPYQLSFVSILII
jgi:hypothetical protein